MLKGFGNHRRVFPYPLLAMAVLTFAMSGPARAVTLQDCAEQAEDVRGAGLKLQNPDFKPGIFFENFQNYIDQVNALTFPDKLVLLDNVSALLSETPADEFEDATSSLRRCVLLKRVEELGGVDDTDDSDAVDATPEPAESANEAEDNLSSPPTPIGDPGSWFTAQDYPAGAMRDERQGRVNFDLTIAVNGTVLGCQASGPPGGSDLESATCTAIMARARFNPATDAAGQPKQGEYSGTINWTL